MGSSTPWGGGSGPLSIKLGKKTPSLLSHLLMLESAVARPASPPCSPAAGPAGSPVQPGPPFCSSSFATPTAACPLASDSTQPVVAAAGCPAVGHPLQCQRGWRLRPWLVGTGVSTGACPWGCAVHTHKKNTLGFLQVQKAGDAAPQSFFSPAWGQRFARRDLFPSPLHF